MTTQPLNRPCGVDVLSVLDRRSAQAEAAQIEGMAAELREVLAVVSELIEVAANVHAACRAGKEPDLIALADALDGVGAKAARKAALAAVEGQP